MNEKVYRYIILGLAVALVLAVAGSGWLHSRSNRKIEGLELQARNHLSLLESYGNGLSQVGGRYSESEAGRLELDRRNRELEESLSGFIERFGNLDGQLYGVESAIGAARKGLRGDIDSLSGVAAEIREVLEAAENLQNGDMEPGGSVGGSVDVPDSGDSL